MEVFCYNRSEPREELASFVHRVQDFCQQHMVVNVSAHMAGPTLILGLTLENDLDIPMANTLTVSLAYVNGLQGDLEEQLSAVLDSVSKVSTEDSPLIPYEVDVVYRPDLPTEGFAVFSIINGTAVPEDE